MAVLVEDCSITDNSSEGPAIGIDLGTTFSCVAVYLNGRAKVIPNEHGNRITPSMISFTDEGIVSGDDASSRLTMKPVQTVYEIKRLLGRTFSDASVQKDINYWPFAICDDNNKPQVQVQDQGNMKTFNPEQISAMVLGKMKRLAETYLRQDVRNAVITVPAYFNETQRKATKDAAQIAGLEVLRIINEPTAAAMAYGINKKGSDCERHVVVFDLGGGTFDVSILVVDGGVIRVKATGGDTHLGGADFDNRIVDKVINWFNKKYSVAEDVTTNVRRREYHRLRKACERAKCDLSQHDTTSIEIEKFHENHDLVYTLNREEFEELNDDLFKKTIEHVKNTLRDASLRPSDIDDIVLIGGSTRIPKVRQCLQELFEGKVLNCSVNPDEAVACGAAIQAAILNGDESAELEDVVLVDITPLSLGINIQGDMTLTIIKRNTLIPCQKTKTLTTTEDNQTRIDMDVYQGERALSQHNHYLGEFFIDDLLPDKKGVARIEVTFAIDANGLLKATAKDKFTATQHSVCIDRSKVIKDKADIDRMLSDAKKYQIEDQGEIKRLDAKNKLEQLANWIQHVLRKYKGELEIPENEQRVILDQSREIITWLTYNADAQSAVYHSRLEELQHACSQIPAAFLRPGHSPDSDDDDTSSGVDKDAHDDIPEVD